MKEFQFKISFFSGVLGIISVFTPVIFHVNPNEVYHFWLWGFTLFLGLNSNEIGSYYHTETDILIPGYISIILILISSVLILYVTLKGKRTQQFIAKYCIIGGIMMIASSLFLIISWQIISVIVMGYPTFWGENNFRPNIAIFLQFIAGTLVLVSTILSRKTRKI